MNNNNIIYIGANSDAGISQVYRLLTAHNLVEGKETVHVVIRKGTKQHKVVKSIERAISMLEEFLIIHDVNVDINKLFTVEVEA